METKKKNKYSVLTIVFATLFMIMNHVLTSITVIPEYAQNPKRFYIYNILLGLTAIGGNLLALYLGYHSEELKDKKPLQTLPGFYLIYVVLTFTINIVCKSFNLSDYWKIFFPISQNMFGFAVSFMLVFLLSPIAVTNLNRFSSSQIKNMFILFSILFVICPTLFGKDIFGFSEGKGVLWIAYLFLVGYVIQRYEIVGKYRNVIMKTVISGFFICFLMIMMTQISLYVNDNVSTANRFSTPRSMFSVFFSINMFIFLTSLNSKYPSLKIDFKKIASCLIIVQILTNWPPVSSFVSTKITDSYYASSLKWSKNTIFIFSIYLLLCISFSIIIILLQKNSFFRRISSKNELLEWSQLIQLLTNCKNWIYIRRKIIYTVAFFYCLTGIQMLILSESKNLHEILRRTVIIFTLRQPQLVLNTIIVMIFFSLIFLITKRFWYAFSFTLTMEFILTVSTILKIEYREEPIMPADLIFISNLNEIVNMVNPIVIVISLVILALLAISTLFIQHHTSKMYNLRVSNKKRILGILITSLFMISFFWVNYTNSPSNILFRLFRIERMYYDQKGGAYINGPIIQFINNIVGKAMIEPEGYSEENIKKVMKKYDFEASEINNDREDWAEEQTIIFVLSESFSDPSRLPSMNLKKDPIPFIKSMLSQTTSGLMLSSSYGGGTANVEWQTLTSMDLSNLDATLPSPYTQLVGKQEKSPSILDLFDSAVAIHPFLGSFYNRINVFEKLGFNSFHYFDSPDGLKYEDKIENAQHVSDEASYKEVLDAINGNKQGSQFIQLTTMQNHVPYKDYYEENDFDFSGEAISSAKNSDMKTYLRGLNYSDSALKKFVDEINKIEKPITLVWYGDHLPGIYESKEIEKSPLQFRETDYFIFNNSFVKNRQRNESYQLVSPYLFPALALEQANIKVTPFYALLTKVAEKIPASTNNPKSNNRDKINQKKIFVDEKNIILNDNEFSKEQKELLREYMLIQYDLVAGKQYSAKWASLK